MRLPCSTRGMVVWVPLDPIDGTRPSLEVAQPMLPLRHIADPKGFLIFDGIISVGETTVLNDLELGDVAAFTPYAPHRSYIAPTMTNTRLSLDLRFSDMYGG